MEEKYKKLSKYLSYLLRHHPEDEGLELDKKGFAPLGDVMKALEDSKHSWATVKDIRRLQDIGDRRRFEMKEDKIRALYGHSIEVELEGQIEPESYLYHGTARDSVGSIFEKGLKPMSREFVHLSKRKKEALMIGRRHDPDPIILRIDASRASQEGIDFYDRGDIVLAEQIPPEYIEVEDRSRADDQKH